MRSIIGVFPQDMRKQPYNKNVVTIVMRRNWGILKEL